MKPARGGDGEFSPVSPVKKQSEMPKNFVCVSCQKSGYNTPKNFPLRGNCQKEAHPENIYNLDICECKNNITKIFPCGAIAKKSRYLAPFPVHTRRNFLKISKSLEDSFLKMKMCVTAKSLIPPLFL